MTRKVYKIVANVCNNNAMIGGNWVNYDDSKLARFLIAVHDREVYRQELENREIFFSN